MKENFAECGLGTPYGCGVPIDWRAGEKAHIVWGMRDRFINHDNGVIDDGAVFFHLGRCCPPSVCFGHPELVTIEG